MRCRPRRSFGSPRTKTGPGLYGQVMDSQKELHSYSREATLEADTVCRPPDPGAPFVFALASGSSVLAEGEGLDRVLRWDDGGGNGSMLGRGIEAFQGSRERERSLFRRSVLADAFTAYPNPLRSPWMRWASAMSDFP